MSIISSIADFFGLKVADGELVEVNEATATVTFRLLAEYIAVSYVSNAISMCEFKTYENGKPVKNELYYALNLSPNPNQSAPEFKAKLVERAFYDKSSLMVQPVKLKNHFYIADSFHEDPRPLRENVFQNVNIETIQLRKTFLASDVCHFRLDNDHDGRAIRELIDGTYRQLGDLLGVSIESYKSANRDRFVLERDQGAGGTRREESQGQDEVNDRLKKFMRGANGILPLNRGQKLTRVDQKSSGGSSADFINLRKDIFEMTANAMKIPQSMMYGNMTNTKDVVDQFITFGVDPHANKISREMTRKFYSYQNWNHGENRIVVDTSTINHADIFGVADKIDKLIGSGVFSIDMVLTALGLDPLNTDYSSAHWVTKNYSRIEDALQMQQNPSL
ncbi:MAG: phage portal protein [Clostridia bacterium]|nr:phage portal protein [Clostridia bacterium]MBQ9785118.1 phage portal protein [Clostridia bacterium]